MQATALFDASSGTFSHYTGRDVEAEEVLAFELGYRVQPTERLSLDVATYYHALDRIVSWDLGMPTVDPGPPPRTIIPISPGNQNQIDIYGVELAYNYSATDHWRLRGGYSFMHYEKNLPAGSMDASGVVGEEMYPKHTAFVRSSADLGPTVQLDVVVRYVDKLASAGIDSYVGLDARLAWRPIEQLEVFVVGRNLLDDYHAEAIPNVLMTQQGEVERDVYAGVTWRF